MKRNPHNHNLTARIEKKSVQQEHTKQQIKDQLIIRLKRAKDAGVPTSRAELLEGVAREGLSLGSTAENDAWVDEHLGLWQAAYVDIVTAADGLRYQWRN